MVLVLVLETRWSSTSTSTAGAEYEYEKPPFPRGRVGIPIYATSKGDSRVPVALQTQTRLAEAT